MQPVVMQRLGLKRFTLPRGIPWLPQTFLGYRSTSD